MKVRNINLFSTAIRDTMHLYFCSNVLAAFGYKDKTKRSFIALNLYTVIYREYFY